MATREEYCKIFERMYENHSVYVGGGNGEYTLDLPIRKIIALEKQYGGEVNKNVRRDLAFIGKQIENGYDMNNSQAADCSGAVTCANRECGLIASTADYRAREYQAMSDPVKLDSLVKGDWVFDKPKEATHMGTYVGDDMVIESKGRDYGFVKRKLSAGPWVVGGRMDWFESEIPPLTRNLKYIKGDRMTGEDVRQCKEQLCAKGCLKAKYVDNIFGKHTDKAVRKFQEQNGLVVDGIVGPKTWEKLWQ